MDGTKDILGVWIGEHESSKFWLSVLNDLKSRGVLAVYLFCVDGLKGFVEAIGAVYPHSQVKRCIVHQIRSSTRFVSYKDIKPLMADLKKVYTAITEDEGLENLVQFKERWGKQYPSCAFHKSIGVRQSYQFRHNFICGGKPAQTARISLFRYRSALCKYGLFALCDP